jgi:apolipoprotein N-acyltransferase
MGVACGVLVALSIPPFGWWPTAWVGFAALALALPGAPWGARALLGSGLGVGQFSVGLFWVHEFSIPGYLALVVISSLFAAAAVVSTPTGRRRAIAIGLPASFVLAEWVRDRFPLQGFPLGSAALGQAAGPLAPSARLGGSLLVTALVVVVGVAAAEVVQAARAWRELRSPWNAIPGRARPLRAAWAGAVLLVLLSVAVPLVGLWSPAGRPVAGGAVQAALVQGGGRRGTRAIDTNPDVVFQRHLEANKTITPPVDLVVWPEGMLQTTGPFRGSAGAKAISEEAVRLGATVVVGVEPTVGSAHYVNEVVAWGPDGEIVSTYVKNHLVPFGEYIPWRSLVSKLFNVSAVPSDGIAGKAPGFMSTPAAPLGVMVSYEVFFDERARGGVRAGGQLLIVPTNTASYSSSQVPAQELAAAKLRAWETGRWLLQVTPTGYTAVVGPSGQVVRRSALGVQEVVETTVPRRTGWTVYVAIGDDVVALVALAALVFAWLAGRAGTVHHDHWARAEPAAARRRAVGAQLDRGRGGGNSL